VLAANGHPDREENESDGDAADERILLETGLSRNIGRQGDVPRTKMRTSTSMKLRLAPARSHLSNTYLDSFQSINDELKHKFN